MNHGRGRVGRFVSSTVLSGGGLAVLAVGALATGPCDGGGGRGGMEVLEVAPGEARACVVVDGEAVVGIEPPGDGVRGRVCRFDAQGEEVWCSEFPGRVWAVARGAEGRVVAGGECDGRACLVGYEGDGQEAWRWPASGEEGTLGGVRGLAGVGEEGQAGEAAGGSVIAVGFAGASGSDKDAWVAGFGADGGLRWQRSWGEGSLDEELKAAAVGDGGRVYVAGLRYVEAPGLPPGVSSSAAYVAALEVQEEAVGPEEPVAVVWDDTLDPDCMGERGGEFGCRGPYEVADLLVREGVVYAGGSTRDGEFFVQTYDGTGVRGWQERYQFQDTPSFPMSYLVAVLAVGSGRQDDLLLVGWGHGAAGGEATLVARVGPQGALREFASVPGPGDDLDAADADGRDGRYVVAGRSWHRDNGEAFAFLFWMDGEGRVQ